MINSRVPDFYEREISLFLFPITDSEIKNVTVYPINAIDQLTGYEKYRDVSVPKCPKTVNNHKILTPHTPSIAITVGGIDLPSPLVQPLAAVIRPPRKYDGIVTASLDAPATVA